MKWTRQMVTRALLALLVMGVLGARAHAQQQQITLNDGQLRALMQPTLSTLQLTVASSGGSVSVALPNGQRLSLPLNLNELRIPMDDPFSDILATVAPIRLTGTPAAGYRDGRVQLTVRLTPVNAAAPAVRTRWAASAFFTPNPPDISVRNIEIAISFALAQAQNSVNATNVRVVVTGDWDLVGVLAPFSGSVRDQINRSVASQVAARFGPLLSSVVGQGVAQYLNARAQLRPVQLLSLRNEPAQVVFVVRALASNPAWARTDPGAARVNSNATATQNPVAPPLREPVINTDIVDEGTGTPREDVTALDWAGLWGDGLTAASSRVVLLITDVRTGLEISAAERAADGSGVYRNEFHAITTRGSLLQPEDRLRLQYVVMNNGGQRIHYTRDAYDGFASSDRLLHRLRTFSPETITEKIVPTEPVYEPAPDPKNVAPKNADDKAAAQEEERKQRAEADAKKNSAPAATDKNVDKKGGENTTQISATEGKIGDWLSNGLWKFRATKVEKIAHPYDAGRSGWGVTIEFTNTNAKKKTLSLFNTGAAGKPILADAGGEPMTLDEGDWQTGAYFKEVLPAQTRTWQIKYFYGLNEKPSAGPERLILEFDPKNGNLRDQGVKFNVADPSFRVFLK